MRVGHLNYFVHGATVGAVALLAVGVHAATTMVTIQVTNDPTLQQDPAVQGGLVAYTDYDATGSNGDVYVYDLDGGTRTRVVSNAASQSLEDIDGSIVVYSDDRNNATQLDVYSVDLGTMTEQAIVVAAGYQTEPVISGSRVAWEHSNPATDPGNVDIYVGCTTGCTPTQITSAPQVQFRPALSGDLLVWEDARSGNPDIFAYWFSAPPAPFVVGENAVATSGALSRNPDVSGTRVVWDQQIGGLGQKDIFLFDFATGITQQITSNSANQVRPRISGNLIVWEDHRNAATGGIDLYGYDLNTNTEIAFVAGVQTEHLQDVDVRPDGGFDIAYTVDQGGGNSDIFVLRALITADPTPTPSATPTASPTATATPTPPPTPTPTPTPTSGDPCDPTSGAPEYFAQTFERDNGEPVRVQAGFAAVPGPGTMCLTLEHVSSAWVDFNDDDVFGPSDFDPNATSARADVTLLANNELGVKLAGKPCGEDEGEDEDDGEDRDDGCPGDRHKPENGGGHHGDGHRGGGHHGDDGDDDDGEGDGDDDGDIGECERMTVRIVGAIPAPSNMLGLIAGSDDPAESAPLQSAEPQPGRGCSVALGTGSPLAGFLLFGSLLLATRRRRSR